MAEFPLRGTGRKLAEVKNQNRVVVITGASAGVGRATAREFARRGSDVALIARGQAGLDAAAKEVEGFGRRALPIQADVADPSAVLEAAKVIEARLGPIDVWVNNAMTSVMGPFWDVPAHEFDRVLHVTFLGYANGTRAALAHMRPRDRGRIVMVGSALAYRAVPLQSAYCAAKAAVVGLTDSLRAELAHEGSHIKLTAVHLPAINTPQFRWVRSHLPRETQPIPPIFQPELAAEAIVWATEHDRRELHVAGPTQAAIVGQKFAPGLMDSYVVGAWEGQMDSEWRDTERLDNLYAPADQEHDAGAHGVFDSRANPDSFFWQLDRRRGWIAGAAAGIAALAAVGLNALRTRH